MRYPKRVALGMAGDDFVALDHVLPTILDVAGLDYPATFPYVCEK